MKKDITVVIIGAIVGAITTALLGMGQIVYPLKESLQMTLSEKNILEKKLSQYMFGETIKIVQTAELSFEVANISHAKHDLLIIKVLVSNLTDKTIYHFGILSRGTSVQTETLDVYGVKRLSVLTTGMLEQNRVGMPIPPNAKHIPISIEVSSINPESKYLTALNLSFVKERYGSPQLVVFNDLPIPIRPEET